MQKTDESDGLVKIGETATNVMLFMYISIFSLILIGGAGSNVGG